MRDEQIERLAEARCECGHPVHRHNVARCRVADCDCESGFAAALAPVVDAMVAEALREALEPVWTLLDTWSDFEHDAVTCPKFDCGDCTMLNAIHDLRAALGDPTSEGR